ncbi:MAG: NYN domain-containing protein [Verrucomicrobia bacterium]|nr:NYN domain-containing protein [Verrucomicrobiota bacterium]
MSGKHILVDGYSILHQWSELKAARTRSLAAGRQALIHLLTQFHDGHGGCLTLVFDGRNVPRGGDGIRTGIQVLYSKEGQTADAFIERMIGQSTNPGHYLVATDDHAEQMAVEGLGGETISAGGFHAMVQAELKDITQAMEEISLKNRRFLRADGSMG